MKAKRLKLSDFKQGDFVTYVPLHADGDLDHPDVEYGRVSSVNDKFVFVKFGGSMIGQPCYPEDLVKR
jgi:hypothetical protein